MILGATILVRFADSPRQRWDNGRGSTTELVSWTTSRIVSARYTVPWRLSVATLSGPAPFSRMPGVRRSFVPVGSDVTLVVDGVRRQVRDGAVTGFDGDADVELTELDRPCHAVNLMSASAPTGGRTVSAVTGELTGAASGEAPYVGVALERAAMVGCFDVVLLPPASMTGFPVPLLVAENPPDGSAVPVLVRVTPTDHPGTPDRAARRAGADGR